MAAKPRKTKTVDKWRKKKYYSVLAPKIFQERELGQSLAFEANSLLGRTISTNLMVLTGNVKKQDINIKFKVNKVQGDTAFSFVESYCMAPAAIKRKVRRHRDKLDDSFKVVTKDRKIVRIKPMIVTRVQTSRPVRAELRKQSIQFVIASIRKIDYDTLVMDVINEKLQKDIAFRIKKVCPIKKVDIRIMQFIGEQEYDPNAPEPVVPEEKPAVKPVEEDVEGSDDVVADDADDAGDAREEEYV